MELEYRHLLGSCNNYVSYLSLDRGLIPEEYHPRYFTWKAPLFQLSATNWLELSLDGDIEL